MENEPEALIRKRRSGRPRALVRRDVVLKLRTTTDEAEVIKSAASDAHLPTATFLRKRALSERTTALPRVDLETAAQLAKLGHVLNQAVILCHGGGVSTWPVAEAEQLREICGRISVRLTTASDNPMQQAD
jgi:hypothetical protein